MSNDLELYRCNLCGQVIEVVIEGAGELVCCGQPMELLNPNEQEQELGEKHIPVLVEDNKKVQIGSVAHPMIQEHYIQFIETVTNDKKRVIRQYLDPNDEPQMTLFDENKDNIEMRALCNVHGLWLNKGEKHD